MDIRQTQMLLASAGYYRGAIDGDPGDKTMAAVEIIEGNARRSGKPWAHSAPTWTLSRRLVAAGQAVLDAQGHEPGDIDGWVGHNTSEALTSWVSERMGVMPVVERVASDSRPDPRYLPRQSEMAEYYGQPGSAELEQRLTYAMLPFELRLDYALDQRVTRLRVHELCAPSLRSALITVESEYGIERMRELGIDRYAGGYNPRRMRGGTSWSTHAYGCAVDFFAQPNALRMRCPRALFCGKEYQPFLDIMEAHNWLPAIRLWGGDAMHFQQARL